MSDRRRLGVLGWPVTHSRSPAIHNAAFAALGLSGWHYQLLPVPPELLAETVRALPGASFAGVNVTIPHKRAALELADTATRAAAQIGAANTLTFADDGTISAENTDAGGLLAALPIDPAGRRAMVLGAGGSARAAVWALLRAGAEVLVWNRTAQRARELVSELGGSVVARPEPADLLVNCTSVGLPGSGGADALNHLGLDADLMGGYALLVDLVYSDSETPLLAAARRHGIEVVDGLEVLVRQGALSFEVWTGVSPPLEVMRRAARGGLPE